MKELLKRLADLEIRANEKEEAMLNPDPLSKALFEMNYPKCFDDGSWKEALNEEPH